MPSGRERMTRFDLAVHRLHSQQLLNPRFETPAEVVSWFGAVQAQDYGAAKWALAQRVIEKTEDHDLDQALAEGAILRTHLLRPTWHFVSPADIRWMLELTAPRVKAAMAYQNRRLELDEAVFSRSNAALAQALQGGAQLTRPELAAIFERAGIPTPGLRFGLLMMRAELDGVVCSGARRGKQFTYALLDERAPPSRALGREQALAELARRYFTSHGPATLKDFGWWSGLAAADAKAGLEAIASHLQYETIDEKVYWFSEPVPSTDGLSPKAFLLPNFDEYTVGYTDRSAGFDAAYREKLNPRDSSLLGYLLVIGGRIAGAWKRSFKNGSVIVSAEPFSPLTEAESQALFAAAFRYGEFLGLPVVLA